MPKRGTKAASTRLKEQVETDEGDDLTLQSTKVSELEYFYEKAGYLFGITACKFIFPETKSDLNIFRQYLKFSFLDFVSTKIARSWYRLRTFFFI